MASEGAQELEQLQNAGFSTQEIQQWAAQRRSELKNAGFSEDEINSYFGKPSVDFKPLAEAGLANLRSNDTALQQAQQNPGSPEQQSVADWLSQQAAKETANLPKNPPPASNTELEMAGRKPPPPRKVKNLADALEAGWQISVSGLSARGQAPSVVRSGNENELLSFAEQATQLVGDLPAMALGAAVGTVGGAETGPGAAITGAAGAFALPTAMRETLMDGYENGAFKDFSDFWHRFSPVLLDTVHSYLTGATVGASGPAGAEIVGPAASTLARGAGSLSAQIATLASVDKLSQGKVPTAQDFMGASAIILGMHAAQSVASSAGSTVSGAIREQAAKVGATGEVQRAVGRATGSPITRRSASQIAAKLRKIYARTGVTPQQVMQDIRDDPSIRDQLLSRSEDIPEQYVTAYHGSPHEFDQFDMSKVGTGEGAQAFGHGLYFAESKGTAGYYAKALGGAAVELNGKRIDVAKNNAEDSALAWIETNAEMSDPFAAAISDIKAQLARHDSPQMQEHFKEALKYAEDLKAKGAKVVGAFNLYKVQIPKSAIDSMLDWDKPLSEQPESVQKALRDAFGDVRPVKLKDGRYSMTKVMPDGSGRVFYDISEPTAEAAKAAWPKYLESQDGGSLYRYLGGFTNDQAATSKVLSDSGIPGVKYLDQQSRSAGEGTRNFVLFDEKLAKIVEGPKTKAGGAGQGEPPQPPPEEPTGGSPPEKKVLSRISVGEHHGRRYNWSDLYRDMVDDLHPIYKAVQAAANGQPLPVTEDPYKLARLNRGVNGKAEYFLEYSPFEYHTYKNVGKSLREILQPVKDNLDDVRAYLVAKRALELNARGINTGVDEAASRSTVEKLGSSMEPVAQEIYQYQDHVLNYLVDSGVISKDAAGAMRQANRDYVPFFRVMETEKGRGVVRGLGTKQPVKKIKGSERKIVDPLESIIKNTYLFMNLADRNAIGAALWDLAEKHPESHIAEFVKPAAARKQSAAEILKANPEIKGIVQQYEDVTPADLSGLRPEAFVNGPDEIAFYRDGVRHVMKVDQDVARVFKGLDSETSNALMRLMSFPAKALRAGAILSPEFVARNPIRDQFSALVFSRKGFMPLLDFAKGIYSIAKHDQAYEDWLRSGGPGAALVSLDRRYLQKNIRQLAGVSRLMDGVVNTVKSPIEALRILSDLSEQGTRVGEFKRVTQGRTGKESILEGGFASREVSLDFSRIGAKTRAVNSIIAFWNANIQGMDKLLRAFKERPVVTSLRIGAGITLPSVILAVINNQDPEYKEIPQWQKDLFWLVHVGNTWYRIPKPFELGILFGSLPERIVGEIMTKDPHAFDGFMSSLGRGASPGMMPTAMQPFIETWANRSLFLGRPIIPADREQMLPQYQYTEYTTEAAKALGKAISYIPSVGKSEMASPAVIENWIRDWSGGLGMHALNVADYALKKAGVLPSPVEPAKTLADIPFIKGFVVRYPTSGTESISRFYDAYDKQQEYKRTFNEMLQEGQFKDAGKVASLMVTDGTLANLSGVKTALGNSMKFVREVYRNPNLTADEKRQLIDRTYFQMIQIARLGNKMVEQSQKAVKENEQLFGPIFRDIPDSLPARQ